MKTVDTAIALKALLDKERRASRSIGFVPTMGALHTGHISLINAARQNCDIVVCSIFVNPTQFNDNQDFDKYPRTISADSALLEAAGCDFLFIPDVKEMYPEPDTYTYKFGALENFMEGANRPGHFNGVGMIVRRLLEIVSPGKAFFGEKDYQQLLVVRSLVEQFYLGTEIVGCPIIREPSGLAMSSRNERLSKEERQQAAAIHQILKEAQKKAGEMSVADLKKWGFEALKAAPGLNPEYFEISDANTLEPVETRAKNQPLRAFVAVWCGPVRLIDNEEM